MKGITAFFLTILLSTQLATPVYGLTINLSNSGNGEDSGSSVTYEATTETTVTQQNQTNINNQTTQTANTGGNECSDNRGGCEIETGDIDSQTSVQNQTDSNQADINQSCEHDIKAENSGNGNGSNNLIDAQTDVELQLTQKNETDVNNLQDKNLNTGRNSAKDNGDDVKIKTGNIYEESETKNNAGKNSAKIGAPGPVSIEASNNKNSHESENKIGVKWSDAEKITQQDDTDINNQENKNLNTGGNECADNLDDDCEIITGDIDSRSKVKNDLGENDLEKNIPKPTATPTPTAAPTSTPAPSPTPAAEKLSPTPAPTAEPTPTEAPQGGVVEPTPTQGPEEVAKEEAGGKEEQEGEEKKPIQEKIKEMVKKLVPEVQAAEAEKQEKRPQVLGVTALPITGLGYNGHGMALNDIIFGLSLITSGSLIRKGLVKGPRRFKNASSST